MNALVTVVAIEIVGQLRTSILHHSIGQNNSIQFILAITVPFTSTLYSSAIRKASTGMILCLVSVIIPSRSCWRFITSTANIPITQSLFLHLFWQNISSYTYLYSESLIAVRSTLVDRDIVLFISFALWKRWMDHRSRRFKNPKQILYQ